MSIQLGKKIKQIRQTYGLTQEAFGIEISNATKSNVSKWEKGLVKPNNSRLKLIAQKGKISVVELLAGENINFIDRGKNMSGHLWAIIEQDGKAYQVITKVNSPEQALQTFRNTLGYNDSVVNVEYLNFIHAIQE